MPQADLNNSSGQEKQNPANTVPDPSTNPQQFKDETIYFYELVITLWKRKWVVIAISVAAALGGILYALQQQHVYKAEALLLPPKLKDIQSMNVLGLQTSIFTSKNVFSRFSKNLNSRSLQKKFILENDLIESLSPMRNPEAIDEEIYNLFSNMIKIRYEDEFLILSIELYDAIIAAQWVNKFVEFIDRETISSLVADLRNTIGNQIKEIEYTIGSKRQMAKQRREDTILQYEEAASIANRLGVMDRVDSTNIVQNNQLNISTTNVPLYFRGYRALESEITFLKNRESDDPFIGGLRDLQEKLALLRSIKFNEQMITAVNIDQPAYATRSPFKPNRRRTVSIVTVVGLISGIFLAFFIEFFQKQRKAYSN